MAGQRAVGAKHSISACIRQLGGGRSMAGTPSVVQAVDADIDDVLAGILARPGVAAAAPPAAKHALKRRACRPRMVQHAALGGEAAGVDTCGV